MKLYTGEFSKICLEIIRTNKLINGGWLDEKQAEANRLSVKNYERVCELAKRTY